MAIGLGECLVKLFLYNLGAVFIVVASDLLAPGLAWAACSTSAPPNGSTVVCTAEGAQTTRVGAGRGNNDVTVQVLPGALINVLSDGAISLGDRARIFIDYHGIVTNTDSVLGPGGNTIELDQNGLIHVDAGGEVLKRGRAAVGNAVYFNGQGNRLVNFGTIESNNTETIWFANQSLNGAKNIIDNYGEIIQDQGHNIIGGAGDVGVVFHNRANAVVRGDLIFGGGDDEFFVTAGSVVTGAISGGGGYNVITIDGDRGSAGSLAGHVPGFAALAKDGEGQWTISGSLEGYDVVTVKNGVLTLTGDNAAYTGRVAIDPAGVLEGRAQSLPVSFGPAGSPGGIENNGLLRFTQQAGDDASYAGRIVGSGAVEKTGAGALFLIRDNTYAGGTTITAGLLQLGDGGTSGSIRGDVVNNGVLALNRSDVLTVPGAISGSGSVRQIGTGTAILTGDSTYRGGTIIAAGVLQLGNGGTSGSIGGDIVNNGVLAFNRSDVLTVPGAISGSGSVRQIGAGTTVLTGDSTYGGGTTVAAGALQLGDGGTSGSLIGNVVNDGALVFSRGDSITFPGVISGSGAVRQTGAGATILTANNTYTGVTSVERGALAVGDAAHPGAMLSGGGQVNVAAGATFGGYGSVPGNIVNLGTIAVASAFPGFTGGPGGNFTIGGVLTNGGHVQIGGVGVGNNLVVGSWVGQNGVIGVNTLLDGDNSPSDRLVINGGSATGASILQVTNVGGLGAQTSGNGIQVVSAQNGATTTAGAFFLARPAMAGPYEYTLYRGARDDSDQQSWYLRSRSQPTPGPTPGPKPLPNYRPATSLYAALPSMALGYGQSIFGTLHERVGEQELLRGRQSANGPAFINGAWGRIIGQHIDQSTSAGGIYGRGPAYNQDIAAFQFGLDIYRREHGDGSRDHAGAYVVSGLSEGNVQHVTGARAGQNRFDAQTIGAYWTHFGATGWYVDAVAQGTWYNAKSSSVRMVQLSPNGFGVGLSLETGYPLQLGGGWIVEPQAQLIYQNIWLDSRYDGAAQIRFSDVESLAGRIGARLSRAWTLDAENGPRLINVWVRANLWNEFLGNPKTWFSSLDGFLPFRSEMKGAWTQLGGGVSAQINGNVALYADASYNIGHGGDRRSWDGKFGLRVNW